MAHITAGQTMPALTFLTAGTSTKGSGAPIALGTRAFGTGGTEWMFVQASAAITQYDCVLIDENYQAASITTTLATAKSGSAGNLIGFAQIAFAQYDMGWVCMKGAGIKCRGLAGTTADKRLYTTTTAGKLGSTSTGVLINGIVFQSAVAASTGTYANAIAQNPVSRLAISVAN